jgi:methylated-DNA-[protein]-cysteine S-methyltransferase
LVTDRDGRLCALDWEEFETRMRRLIERYHGAVPLEAAPAPDRLRRALDAYFAGALGALEDIECRTGGTAFQRAVWAALRKIRPGETLSYGALAAGLGAPSATRAVGAANGANPVSLVIPCHRVIGADGSLTGYGGGLDRKRWLLRHEGAQALAA